MSTLPEHLVKAWGHLTIDPRDNPRFCLRQSRKTPHIPWHNGYPRCLSCHEEIGR
jgi:hypothetical protein